MRYRLAGGAVLAAMFVCAAPAFGATHLTVRYGAHVVLHGNVMAGMPVTLSSSARGKTAQGLLSTSATTNGSFHFEVKPTVRTSYVAQSDASSETFVVDVMPRLGLRRNGTVRVSAPCRSTLPRSGN